MDALRNLERRFFSCPEINSRDYAAYPALPDEDAMEMAREYVSDPRILHVFPVIRKPRECDPYVEIYICDSKSFPECYRRFIFLDGYRLSEKDEEDFLCYTRRGGLVASLKRMKCFIAEARNLFPQWHLVSYKPHQIKMVLEHIYFVSHRSGAREILYKAELNNLAYYLDELPEYNILGTSPESIISCDPPLGLLRIANQDGFLDLVRSQESIERAKKAYEKYSGYIGKTVSWGQWEYLEELANTGSFGGKKFNKTLFSRLNSCDDSTILDAYKKYLHLQSSLSDVWKEKMPYPVNVYAVIDKMEAVQRYRNGNLKADEQIKRRKEEEELEYSDNRYAVIMPENAFDLCREGLSQHNCVMEYIAMHARRDTTILFVRKKTSLLTPFVTIEIREHEIRRVYGKYNILPQKDVFLFLEKYAKDMWLFFDPYAWISENVEIDEEQEMKELLAYAEDFRKRAYCLTENLEDEVDYKQMTMEELMPDAF